MQLRLAGRSLKIPRIIPFLASGVPGLGVAFGLNHLLVGWLKWNPVAVYPGVLLVQMLTNYSVCRRFVFGVESRQLPYWSHFAKWAGGTLVIRGLDWVLYSGMVSLGLHYFLAQVINVILFSLLRYSYNLRIFGATGSGRAE